MTWRTIVYGISMAGLLLLLRAIEYRHLVYDLQEEYFVGSIALLFTTLGLWMGWKFTHRANASGDIPASDPAISEATRSGAQLVSASAFGISPREEEVLRLIAAGHSNQEIADTLFLSLNTIKKHTTSLFRELEAERRTQAIDKARQLGLLA